MLFEELNWELKQGDDTFRDSVNLSILICHYVFIILCSAFDHSNILNIISERRYRLHYDVGSENDPCAVHPKSLNASVKHLLLASLAVGFQEAVMLSRDNLGHEDVNVVALDFEHGVAEKFLNPLIGLHDLSLLLSGPVHYDHGRVVGKHDIELVLLLFSLLLSFQIEILHLKFLSLVEIILNLLEVVPVKVERVRVAGVDPCKERPKVTHSLAPIDNIQTQLVDHVEINHIGVKVRPELDMVRCRHLDSLLKLIVDPLEGNDYADIEAGIGLQPV